METKSATWRPGGQQNVCRCCLSEGCYKDISTEYFWMGKREVYADMLSDTFDVSISYGQMSGLKSHTRLICEPCIARLRDASEFKKQVIECERSFIQLLAEPGTSTVQDSEAEDTEQSVKLEELGKVKVEKLESDDDDFEVGSTFHEDDDDDDLDDQPLTKFATKVPKKEAADLLDLIDNTQVTVKRKAPAKAKAPPAKKAKTVKEAKPSASKKAAPAKPAEKKKKDVALSHEKQNAAIILTCTTAYPFRLPDTTMMCVYCGTSFESPHEFREHMSIEHTSFNLETAFAHVRYLDSGYIKSDCTDLKCRLCLLPFSKMDDIANHLFRDHGKPINFSFELGIHPFNLKNDKMSCFICDKNFLGLRQLSRHLSTHYPKHTCETCGKSYMSSSSLTQHIHFGHRGNSYICRKCRMKFMSSEEYKRHMDESIECWMHICNVCGEKFRGWHIKESHMVEKHGEPPKTHKCVECGKSFDNRKTLRVHFKFSHTDEAIICSYCGRKFDYRRELNEHLPVHTKQKSFICTVCSKSFGRKKNLAQHMWIHEEKKRFECVPCDRKFNQRVSWRSHMKTHHPEEGVI